MLPIKCCYMTILLLATCFALVSCALEPAMTAAEQFPDNPNDKNDDVLAMHKRPSFFVGSRYGRSGGGAPLFANSKSRRLNVVPRNDRFFLGSRYGKRSGEYMSPYEQENSELPAAGTAMHLSNKSGADGSNAPYMMSCIFTGLKNFYHCNSIEEINNIINQLTTAQNDNDD